MRHAGPGDGAARLRYATRQGRAIVTADIADFGALAAEAIAANTEHAGIILMSTGFRGNEVAAIADGMKTIVDRYPAGLRGAVVYATRARS